MPNTTLTQINTAIFTILDTLDGSGQPLSVVYDWPNPDPASLPCAYVVWQGSRESVLDTASDEELADFVVRVILRDDNNEDTYDALLSVVELVKAELRKDDHRTLGGLVTHFEVSPRMEAFRTSEATFPLVYCDLLITVHTLQSITQ